jgi:uncharacterized protein (DUF1330 family)
MTAYVIVEIDVTDPAPYETYKQLAEPAIAAHGGRYLVRGGAPELIEGDRHPTRQVVLEFKSKEQAKRWYDSPEYRKARDARAGAARMNMVLVEGV